MTLPADYLANTNELICRQGVAAVVDGRVHAAWGTARIASCTRSVMVNPTENSRSRPCSCLRMVSRTR
jgi:hypothetical protein